jgi:hypothetical protein
MGMRFAIEDWAAAAPGLHARPDWQAWARAPWRPEGALEVKLEEMAAMQRRRLNPLGRAAAQVAWTCHAPAADTPVVLASGYGDAQRCLQLLKNFAAGEAASPTDFALSVHNAIGAMYSIARGDQASYASVAAGPASAAAGLVEVGALLADGARAVLLVCYDAPLPGEYADFDQPTACAYAWAWRVSAARPGQPHFELAWTAADGDDDDEPELPFGLEALRFAVSDAASLSQVAGGTRWNWSRHA